MVAALERSFDALCELQAETGVAIVVENMPGVGCSHLTGPGDLDLRGLGFAPRRRARRHQRLPRRVPRGPAATLRHVHLHSNAGLGDFDDPHLPVGAGVVDAAAVLAAARAAGASVVLEHDNEAAVLASIAHLRARGLLD